MGRAEQRKAVAAAKKANPGLRAGTRRPQRVKGAVLGAGPHPRVPPPKAFGATKAAVEGSIAAAAERDQARAAAQAEMLRKVVNSIPPDLRDTPEAKLMLSRLAASWDVPVHPKDARRYAEEWQAFLASTRAGRLQSAAQSGLWVPGMPQ